MNLVCWFVLSYCLSIILMLLLHSGGNSGYFIRQQTLNTVLSLRTPVNIDKNNLKKSIYICTIL